MKKPIPFHPSDFESKWPRTTLASSRGLRPRVGGARIRGKQSFNPTLFESKWQEIWERLGVYQPDLKHAKRPFYNLMMFPYPSAEGLHVGNMYAFTGADIYGRFKRMQGNDVFEPIGLDGFGIHSENYALKIGKHPKEQAKISSKNFYRQLRASGNGFAFRNTLETYDPDYYRWTQWIFVQMFKHGLAYRRKSLINFCPSCKTVLSDEQVINGACERCKTMVVKKEMEQWFFKITAYAEKLLQNTYQKSFQWSEKVKIGQRNWIGKKEGINITYEVVDNDGKPFILNMGNATITCFTTRPDTNFGATFVVVAPEHPFVDLLLHASSLKLPKLLRSLIRDYVAKSKAKSEMDRIAEGREKTGVFTGFYAINQLNNYKMPIYITDFVLGHVGTGAVVGVPGHDKRDFEFAQKFNLPVMRVVVGKDGDTSAIKSIEQVQEEEGTMVNSGFLNGMDIQKAIGAMMDYLEEKGYGSRVTTYKLRDWCISRQRYWGAPIPMIYCEKCDWVPVPEDQLPVLLPDLADWKPEGTGKGPLAKLPSFYNVACPKCSSAARRETDVCDTFLDSSWYFLRYPSVSQRGSTSKEVEPPKERLPWDPDITRHWLPVHIYIGGAEHTVLHLLYARFVTMAFKDWRLIDFEEPFSQFYAHGLIIAEGAKMSKSKGNIVIPDEYINKYGADTLRIYLMFLGPFDAGGDFRDTGVAGMYRFLSRVWRLVDDFISSRKSPKLPKSLNGDDTLTRVMHRTIKEVTQNLENLRYNTAIAHIMEFVNELQSLEFGAWNLEFAEALLLLLAPFAPHMTEELWSKLKIGNFKLKINSIHLGPWPTYDPKYLEEKEVEIVVQVNGKIRDTIKVQSAKCKVQSEVEEKAKKSKKIAKYLSGKTIDKVIFVPGRLLNFVV